MPRIDDMRMSDGADAPPTVNFTITSNNTLTFSALIDGTDWYHTATGEIETGLQDNATTFHDFVINATNYRDITETNWNVTSPYTFIHWKYPMLTLLNYWNNTNLTTFTAEVNGTNYSTTTTELYIPLNDTSESIIYYATDYIMRTITHGLLMNSSYNNSIWQSITTLWASEIRTGNLIQNWTINTSNGAYNTTNYNITIRPNWGTYSINWTNELQYINQTELTLTIDEASENLSIQNLYARNISFTNELGIQIIHPTCTQDGYTYNTPYYMPKSNTTTNCNITGYQNKTLTLQPMADTSTYNMTPAMLWLIFSEQTIGYIETEECDEAPNNCDWFNSTSIYIQQANISIGRVVVKFNPDGEDWQQIFEYDNDNQTHIKEYLQIITPDLQQLVKVTGAGVPLEDTRVTAKIIAPNPETNITDWITVYADFTDANGIASLLINDENTYKICAQKEGYITECRIDMIAPASTDTIVMNLEATEQEGGYNFIESSCSNIYIATTNCTLEVNTYKSYNTICVNYTSNTLNTSTCSSDSVSKIFSYTLTNLTGDVTLNIFLDGTFTKQINHEWMDYDPTITIDWDTPTDTNGTKLLDRIKGDTEIATPRGIRE